MLLASTFSLLIGAPPEALGSPAVSVAPSASGVPDARDGGKISDRQRPSGAGVVGRVVWNATRRRVRAWLCPWGAWARLQLDWTRWSSGVPTSRPPELAALLAHAARSIPLDAPS